MMSELYAEESVAVAIEAGKRAVSLGLAKTFDVHFSDACIKTVLEVNALTFGHDDGPDPVFSMDHDGTCAAMEACISNLESPQTVGGPAQLNPAMIALLIQLAGYAKTLYDLWRASR